jgi:hypothetical protein
VGQRQGSFIDAASAASYALVPEPAGPSGRKLTEPSAAVAEPTEALHPNRHWDKLRLGDRDRDELRAEAAVPEPTEPTEPTDAADVVDHHRAAEAVEAAEPARAEPTANATEAERVVEASVEASVERPLGLGNAAAKQQDSENQSKTFHWITS